jgi:spermidine synthase
MEQSSSPSVMKRKWFLYFTGFFSGMSVMAIELGASRLLAPYFSSSQIVWTIIIGTIMIAMAIGNVLGGRMADRNTNPAKLYRRLLFVAIWTAAIPFVGKYVIAGVTLLLALFVSHNFLIWASFLSCLILFVCPLLLLGTVTPSLIKYATNSLDDNGKTVGELEALGTIGSIIGTFLPTFVTIPTVGTSRTFLIFACILALLSLVYFLSAGHRRIFPSIVSFLILIAIFIPFSNSFAFWERDLAYEGESIYNYLQVKETDETVTLSTNVAFGVQSVAMKSGGLTGLYYDYALAAPLMASAEPDTQDVLILGLGTGTFAKQCLEYFPGISVSGVEIDEKIAGLAKEYFDLPEDVAVTVYDGRAYLQNPGQYDVIMVDAYQDITIPFQMSTVEFFTEVKQHLKPGGVMVVNLNMRAEEGQENALAAYLSDTIHAVFSSVYTVQVGSSTNAELFASDNSQFLTQFSRRLQRLPADSALSLQMQRVQQGLCSVQQGGRILTDDKAPVEVLGMQSLDSLITKELSFVRDAFRSGDFSAVFG